MNLLQTSNSCVNNILEYVNTEHPVLPKYFTAVELVALEDKIHVELQNSLGSISGFREILFTFGWNGLHFRTAHGSTINMRKFVDSLTNELLNIYREGVVETGNHFGSASGREISTSASVSASAYGKPRQQGFNSFSLQAGGVSSFKFGIQTTPSVSGKGGGDLRVDIENRREDNLTLQSYCPDILFECNNSFKEPVRVSVTGACVLIDISGFTKLSNSLCQKGSSGLDRLHSATDVYLGYFSDTVYQYGGDGE